MKPNQALQGRKDALLDRWNNAQSDEKAQILREWIRLQDEAEPLPWTNDQVKVPLNKH